MRQALINSYGPWSSFSPMGDFVECSDSSPHGSESGNESKHSTFGGLNDDQGLKDTRPTWLLHLCIASYRVLLLQRKLRPSNKIKIVNTM